MTCRLKYIDETKVINGGFTKDTNINVDGTGINLADYLTLKHVEVAKEFQNFTMFKLPQISRKSTVSDKFIKYFRLPIKSDFDGENRRKQLIEHINKINDDFNTIKPVIHVKELDFNGDKHNVIYIDSRPFADKYTSLEETDYEEEFDFDNYFSDLYKNKILSDQEQTFEEYVQDNSQKFSKVLENVRSRIFTFLSNPNEIESDSTRRSKNDLRKLMYQINNPEITDKMRIVDKFIKEAVNFSNDSFNRIRKGNTKFDSYKLRLEKILTNNGEFTIEEGRSIFSKQKLEDLSDLTREVEKIKNKLYIFNYLKEFQKEMIDNGIVDNIFELYNSFTVEKKVTALLKDNNFSSQDIEDFLTELYGTKYRDTDDFKKSVENQFFKKGITLEDTFIDSMRIEGKNKTFTETINEAVSNLNSVIEDTKELSLELVASTLYPYYLKGWTKETSTFNKSFQKNYDQFKASILLSQEKPGLINPWIAGGEQQDDDLTFSIAKTIFDNLRVQDTKTFVEAQDAYNKLKEIIDETNPVNSSKRLELEEKMIVDIHELDEESTVKGFSETLNGFKDIDDVTYEILESELDENGQAIHIKLKSVEGEDFWITKTNSFSFKWVKTITTKGLVHNFKYRNEIESKVFRMSVESEVARILSMLDSDQDNLLPTLTSSYHNILISKMKKLTDNGDNLDSLNDRNIIKNLLTAGYYSATETPSNNEKTVEALVELKKVSNNRSIFEEPFVKTRATRKWFYDNTYDSSVVAKFKKGEPYTNLEFMLDETMDNISIGEPYRLMAIKHGGKNKLLIEKQDGELEFILFEKNIDSGRYQFHNNNGEPILVSDIKNYYVKSGNLKETKFSKMSSEIYHEANMRDSQYARLYDFYIQKHKSFNSRLGVSELKHFKLPQIPKEQTLSIKQKLYNIVGDAKESINDFFEGESKIYVRDKDGNMLDKNGNITDDKEKADYYYYNRQDLDGYDSQRFVPKFTTRIKNQDNLETDLFISFMTFNDSVGKFHALYDVEPQMRMIRTIVGSNKGDFKLFTGREQIKGKFKPSKLGKFETEAATRTANNIIQMINHYVYGDEKVKEDWMGKNVNPQKIANLIKGLNAYQVLAFNWVASFTNLEVGIFNNFSTTYSNKEFEGINGHRFKLTQDNLRKGYTQYFSYLQEDMIDSAKTNFRGTSLYEKNPVTQLAVMFDAIKGNEVKVADRFENKNVFEKYLSKEGLFISSAIPEHMNQLPLMIAMMMSYKISDNFSLWDSFKAGSNEQKSVRFLDENGQDMIGTEQLENLLNDFMVKLSAVNSEAHGNYSKYDVSMLSRYALGGLALQFGRWIYPSFKARFVEGHYSKEVQDYVDRGYVRWYLKSLVSDTFTEYSFEWDEDKKFFENVREQILDKSKNAFLSSAEILLVNGLGKQLTHVLDKIPFVNLSERSEWIHDWLYGNKNDEEFITKFTKSEKLEQLENETDEEFKQRLDQAYERRKLALIRATWELTIIIGGILMGMSIAAFNDDDDDKSKVLMFLELQCKRFVSDVGIFAPSISPFGSWDFILRKLKDPFAITGQLEKNVAFLSQLLGFNITEGSLNFKFNDVYEKKGSGYEKGDSKLFKRFEKLVLSPYYQVIRLMNPQELENTLNLLNKNSIISGSSSNKEEDK
jgi:hypothetical protein